LVAVGAPLYQVLTPGPRTFLLTDPLLRLVNASVVAED
jgi:hypothetical protein